MLKAMAHHKKVAFWGHGLNHQASLHNPGNLWKRLYSTHTCWWFAYTEGVAKILSGMGFPRERITVLNNAIDTENLIKEASKIDLLEELKQKLKIGNGPIGLYCGRMYQEKRIDFLLQACQQIKRNLPSFQMIFIGSGPEEDKVIRFANQSYDWVHYVGPQFGSDRIPYFVMSDVFLHPGAVGLAILDAFALETPMVTTDYPFHGPEIEYLENGINGVLTENSIYTYTDAVIKILTDIETKNNLIYGCQKSARKYTINNMVNNFCEGIFGALSCR